MDRKYIKEIDKKSITFLAAGEKISDIETVIRELVENSIDAGARNIEVRLSRFGVDAIEVEDNGCGIDDDDFAFIGLRYHTSKINDYKKFQENLETFGFRGEALSCLCNIANVTIITKAQSSSTGTKLIFNKDGTLQRKEKVARADGTTVIVKNLFHSMPVRRRQLETTAKRQYDKVVKLLYEQILARPQIKITLCKKASLKKEKDFTHGGSTLRGCIITIFGVKTLESSTPFQQKGRPNVKPDFDIPLSADITKAVIKRDSKFNALNQDIVSIEGDAGVDHGNLSVPITDVKEEPSCDEFFKRSRKSKFAREKPEYSICGFISKVGMGRNSSDCQFLYVNKKPCDIPRLSRLINDIFKGYSNNQYPFYCLFIDVQSWAADFNVPRKRSVILQDENKLCDIVQESLDGMFSSCAPASQKSCPQAQLPYKCHLQSPVHGMKRQHSDEEMSKTSATPLPIDQDSTIRKDPIDEDQAKKKMQKTADEMVCPKIISPKSDQDVLMDNPDETGRSDSDIRNGAPVEPGCPAQDKLDPSNIENLEADYKDALDGPVDMIVDLPCDSANFVAEFEPAGSIDECELIATASSGMSDIESRFEQSNSVKEDSIQVTLDHVEDIGSALLRERAQRRVSKISKEFSYSIHPKFNTVAEQELKINLNKNTFLEMQVLGQFNNGFIIAQQDKHIFIVDQHATDERANYEDQLEKSPLVSQQMVHPKLLYLNSIQENTIIENLEEFKRRGLDFMIDLSKSPGYRVQLTSTSICKGQGIDEHLDKHDIEELIDVIIESPNSMRDYTLKKVRNIAATRACRKSVMIGDKLNWAQMSEIVSRMSTLRNPWICAHNRPTIRHLMDTDWMDKKK